MDGLPPDSFQSSLTNLYIVIMHNNWASKDYILECEHKYVRFQNVANLKQKNVYLQFQNLAIQIAMRLNSSQSNIWTDLRDLCERKQSSNGFQQLALLFNGIHTYSEAYCDSNNERIDELSIAEQTNQRMQRVEAVSRVLDLMINDCKILDEQKMDCLEEILKLAKKLYGATDKSTRMSTKRSNQNQKVKLIRQQQLNIIQKMVQFILKWVIPQDLSIKKAIEIVSTIADQFFVLKLNRQELEKPKGKFKKREGQLNMVTIEYNLMSGKKVPLVWLLIFRVLQKLMNFVPSSPKGKESKENLSINEQIETRVSKTIKEVIYFLMKQGDSYILLKNLLTCLVDNVREMELPIVPLFLAIYYEILIDQFKRDYQLLRSNDTPQQIFGKSIYSLDNFSTLTQLIKGIALDMPYFTMEKQITQGQVVCSYCGIPKGGDDEKHTYQKIGIKLNGDHHLIIRICASCCKILGFQPGNKIKIDAFAPLIFSRFWNVRYVKTNIEEIRQSLRKLLIYHFDSPQKKHSSAEIEIAESIAMNNIEETTSNHIIEGVYRSFLYYHNKLALKDIIFEAFNVLAIYLNALDDKIRQKAIRICSQPYVVGFVFHENHKLPGQYIDQAKDLRQKMLAMIQLKCRDSDINVRLIALEILLNIYSKTQIDSSQRQEFFKIIFKEIAFSKNTEYITKSIDIIEKSIISKASKKKGGKSDSQYFKLVLKTFIFSLQCIDSTNSAQLLVLKQKISKLINKLLKTIYQFCYDEYNQQETKLLLEECNNFLGESRLTKIKSLKNVYVAIIIKMFQEIHIDVLIMKNIPYFSAEIVDQFITEESKWNSIENVKANMMTLIQIVLQDAVEVRDFFKKTRHEKSQIRCMFKSNELQDYFSSSHFIQSIVKDLAKQQNDSQKSLSYEKVKGNSLKRALLNEIITLSNFCTSVNNVSNYSNCFKLLAKNSSKTLRCQFQLTISSFSMVQLENSIISLLQSIKYCGNQQIKEKGSLIVNILVALGRSPQINSFITIYEKITNGFLQAISLNINAFEEEKQQSEYQLIISRFGSITRSLSILTSFIVSNEKYLSFNEKLINMAEKHDLQTKNKKKSTKSPIEVTLPKDECKVSVAFENTYNLIMQVLQIQFLSRQNDISFVSYRMELMLLLNSFWQIHPEIILTSSNFLRQLANINQPYLIKNLYKLFLSLIPCTDIKILTIINNCFTDSFSKIFEDKLLKNDEEVVEFGFKILQYLLKSGMTRLYGFNRYIYCGLLHPLPAINKMAGEIIRQIYEKQASEKLLFANFSQSMKFLFQFYFNIDLGIDYSGINISLDQKQSLKTISNLTKIQSKCFLAKQKRQIRLKTTFTKKLSEIILKQSSHLKQNPLYLMFLAKLLKSISCFDYCELYQATFSVNKAITENNSLIEKIRERTIDEEVFQEENVIKHLCICLSYRQLTSCLTYLTSYQQVQLQLKNYNKLLQASVIPYVNLRQDCQLTPLSTKNELSFVFTKIFEDIDINFEIAIGVTEYIPEKKINRQDDSINQNTEEAWSETMETKPKKRGGKKRKNVIVPRRSTRNRKNISYSASKGEQTDSNNEFSNNSLKQSVKPSRLMRNLQSQESIY